MNRNRETTASESRHRSARMSRGLLVAGAALLAGLTACEAPASNSFMSIGTGGTGGIYYVLGGAFASHMNESDPDRQYTAEVTGASVENVSRVRQGQLDLGIVMAISAYEAYHGGEDYPEPVTNLRILAPLYPNVTHLLVRQGLQIESVGDLRGRRVSVGSPGSGTEQVSRHLLEAGGLSYDDVDARYLSFTESSAALQDGAIDAAIISVGYPAAAVLEATTTGGAQVVPIDDASMQAILDEYPYYDRAEIPAGVYRGVTESVPTLSMMNWVISRDDLPDDVVNHFLGVLTNQRDALIQVHEMARQIDLSDLDQAPIPVHPAVETWRAEHPS